MGYGRRAEKWGTQTDRFTLQQSLETKCPGYPRFYGLCYPFFHRNLKLNFPESKVFHGRCVHLGWQKSTTPLLRVEKIVLTGFPMSPFSLDTRYCGHFGFVNKKPQVEGGYDRKALL